MVLRNIVKIDEEKCNGCGKCVTACAEGAIEIINGKAKLVSETYCDGLGACLGHCPQDAITIEQRHADAFDEQATKHHIEQKKARPTEENFVCPGLAAKMLSPDEDSEAPEPLSSHSQLRHWPVQLKLVAPNAPFLQEADVLLVADCVAFAMPDFHSRLLKDRSVVVGCPKLDDAQYYVDKLSQILQKAKPRSLTVVHMDVPCCSGLTRIANMAREQSGVDIDFQDITVSLKGQLMKHTS